MDFKVLSNKYIFKNRHITIHKNKTTRLVFITRNGLVIKLAKLNPSFTIKRIKYQLKRFGFKAMLYDAFIENPKIVTSIRFSLFRGILANHYEYQFWKKERLEVCMPSSFSLLGLVNIQSFGKTYKIAGDSIWSRMIEELPYSSDIQKEAHTFGEEDNYGVYKNNLKLLDYGSKEAQSILREYKTPIIQILYKTKFKLI